ncbi:MAG TPA: hypothetical protein VK866_11515 [Acidimicrobiales bacterium]|nr:hypothetical protein [Acidimicrobiales bacterium]
MPEFAFPPDGQPADPSWWAPLEGIARLRCDERHELHDELHTLASTKEVGDHGRL